MALDTIEQVVEFAYQVNQRSADEALARLREVSQQRKSMVEEEDRAQTSMIEEGETESSKNRSSSSRSFQDFLRERAVSQKSTTQTLTEFEKNHILSHRSISTEYYKKRRDFDLESDTSRLRLSEAHQNEFKNSEDKLDLGREQMGAMAEEAGKKEETKGLLAKALGTFNKYGGMAGLPHIPTDLNELATFLKQSYDMWRSELSNALRISAAGGWNIQDIDNFMFQLNIQKGLFPSLADEIDKTTATLNKGLPALNDGQLLELVNDVRRAAFIMGTSMEELGQNVQEVARVTGRSGDDVIGAFLTVHSFVKKGDEAGVQSGSYNLDVLRGALTDLTKSGARYGISLEESVFLVKEFATEINRGLITVDDLIRMATGLSQTETGKKSFLAFEIVDRLQNRSEFKELVDVLRPFRESNDFIGSERLMEVIVQGAEGVAKDEYGIDPATLNRLQQQVTSAGREAVIDLAGSFEVKDKHERAFIEEMLFVQYGLASEGMTPDQRKLARDFGMKDAAIRGGIGKAEGSSIDLEMTQQESVFKQTAGLTNAALLLLSTKSREYLETFKSSVKAAKDSRAFFPSPEGIEGLMAPAGLPGTGYAVPSEIPTEFADFYGDIDHWAKIFNVQPALIMAIIMKESNGYPHSLNFADAAKTELAVGLMQIMDYTAEELQISLGDFPESANISCSVLRKSSYWGSKLKKSELENPKYQNLDQIALTGLFTPRVNILFGTYHIALAIRTIAPGLGKGKESDIGLIGATHLTGPRRSSYKAGEYPGGSDIEGTSPRSYGKKVLEFYKQFSKKEVSSKREASTGVASNTRVEIIIPGDTNDKRANELKNTFVQGGVAAIQGKYGGSTATVT